ncbi:hypothetical protein CAOG_08516 [Capsaspora owczarzaki ATCC 30864]|nr:hypothetical protein CAOG_08516 [Capsaspora owczarzaki ATCC 30864]|eukprot:XP_011270097.1 hypothetical protein CAOG_08516 [Capsaspora owczarzaki ATCC 30864]
MLARLLQFLTGPLSSSSHAGYASQLTSAIGQNKQNDSVQKDTSAAGSFVPSLGAPSATLPTSVSPRSSFSFLRTVRNSTTMSPSPSLSVLTGPPPSFSFLDLNVKDIVEQLTLVELGRIKRITAHSLTGQAWNKSSRPAHAVPVLDVIERFNRVSFWVASEICACVNIKARVEILKRCIKIAAMCRDIKNFNTCLQFVAALNISAVQRLKQTWKQLSTKYASLWVELNRLMDTAKGYTNYRSHLASLTLPIVPYIGIHLNDLTLIEEGNPTFLEANGMPTTSTTSSPGSSAATTPSPQGPPSATLPASTASSSSAAPSLRKSSSRDRVEATSPRTPAEAHLTPLAAQAAVGLASSRGSLAFYKEPAGVTPIVNFKKMAMIAQVIRVVEWYQTSEYEFVAYPELQYWLVHGINVWDVNRLYKESLICEPRVSDLPSTAAGDLASGDGKPKRRNKFMSTRGTSPRDSTGSLTVSPSLSASNSASMVGAANNSAPVPSSSPSLASLLSSSSSDNKPKKRSIFGSRRASSSDESSSISAAQVALQLEGLGDSSSVSSMTGSVDQSAALEVRMAQLRLVQETTEAQLHDLQHANEILLRRVEELERTHVAAHTREVGLLARIEALEADAAQKTVKKPVQA